jgi:Zn-dependent protease with chaperone function
MNFFEHQDDARRRSGRLVLLFAAAVVGIVVAVYFVALFALLATHNSEQAPAAFTPQMLWNPRVFVITALGVGAVIAAGSLYRTATLAGGGKVVAETLGGRLLNSATGDFRERRLLNVVEEMALASGVPVPPVYLLESETEINAFAAGFSATDAVIGITRGAVNSLTRDELQGVIAHEFSHILNGDMRLNIRLIGLLHGILLLSLIGYVVMRMLLQARPSGSSRRSSDSDKKDNTGAILLVIFLVGLGLYVIGYIGVFFGHLIKSAVSRQREYLADASAVQFTRNPGGIGDALKKLGAIGSRIRNSQAEQASHMYFGNGMKASFFNLLATHPPLADRIRRIEPSFDGDFSAEHLTWPSEDEAKSEAKQEAKKPAAGAFPFPVLDKFGRGAAGMGTILAGTSAFGGGGTAGESPMTAASAVSDVGEPKTHHFDFAAALIGQLPEELADAIHKPNGAAAVVYALLLEADPADDEPGLRMITKSLNRETSDRVRALIRLCTSLGPAARLPLAQLAMSALRQLSPNEFEQFRQTVIALIRADRQVSLFEYCLQRIIFKHLVAFFRPKPPARVRYESVSKVVQPLSIVLSVLAHAGQGDDAAARESLAAGAATLGLTGKIELLSPDQTGYSALDAAFGELAASSGAVKQQVLNACGATIAHDGKLTIDEAELLRTVADALDCPMPPPAAELMKA